MPPGVFFLIKYLFIHKSSPRAAMNVTNEGAALPARTTSIDDLLRHPLLRC